MNEISPALGAIITANNYLHDVATGLMLMSFGAIWLVSRRYTPGTGRASAGLYLSLYEAVTRIAKLSLVWILLGGIPRTIYYTRLEWAPAIGETQVIAIVIKHVLVFALVGAGIYYWLLFKRQANRVRQELAL